MIRAILFIFFYPGVSSQIFQTVKRNSVWKGFSYLKEIFEQYGGVIITVVAIAALAALVTAIMGNGTSGPVYDAFKNLIDNFGNNIGTP